MHGRRTLCRMSVCWWPHGRSAVRPRVRPGHSAAAVERHAGPRRP